MPRSSDSAIGAVLLVALVIAGPAAGRTEKAGTVLPAAVQVGDRSLPLTACGVRDTLWIDHFVSAIYLPAGNAPARALLDSGQPKAVRVEIVNATWLPDRNPERWREPLRRSLSAESYDSLRRGYRTLEAGDVLLVEYRPQAGLTVSLGRDVLLREPNHEPIEAILEAWADDDEPLAEKARRLLREHPCG